MKKEERSKLYREVRRHIKSGSASIRSIHAYLDTLPFDSEKSQALRAKLERMCECNTCSK